MTEQPTGARGERPGPSEPTSNDDRPAMHLILITGGARSGKSRYAERLAADLGGDAVTFVATARASDDEMARRIRRHREDRPAAWTTVEAPVDAGAAVREAATDVVLLDCLTLLAANALAPATDYGEVAALEAVRTALDRLLAALAGRDGTLIVVTNEVGLGIVPATPVGRWFRDALGEANQRLAARADEVVLMVSGIPVRIGTAGRDHAGLTSTGRGHGS